jgi:hypothetical protein
MNIVWGNDIHANFYNQYEKYDYHVNNIRMVCHPQFQLGTNFGSIRSLLEPKVVCLNTNFDVTIYFGIVFG